MKVELYSVNDDSNVINKTMRKLGDINVSFRRGDDVVSPKMILKMDSIDFNYVYIDGFKRYYMVDSFNVLSNGVWEVFLSCDVLESYKDDILNSNCNFYRGFKDGDFQDVNLEKMVKSESVFYKSKTVLELDKKIILSIVRG